MENNNTVSTLLVANAYGPADVLTFQDFDLGELRNGYARIKTKAAGINPIDARRMTGEFKHAGLPQTFGTEFSGEILAIGENSQGFQIGMLYLVPAKVLPMQA